MFFAGYSNLDNLRPCEPSWLDMPARVTVPYCFRSQQTPLEIETELDDDKVIKEMSGILEAGVVARLDLVPLILTSLLSQLREVVSAFVWLVPEEFYLPYPPSYCPQPTNTKKVRISHNYLTDFLLYVIQDFAPQFARFELRFLSVKTVRSNGWFIWTKSTNQSWTRDDISLKYHPSLRPTPLSPRVTLAWPPVR